MKCCNNSNHINTKEELFYTINLEVKDKENIYDSLKSFIECEYLENDNKVYCSKCKKLTNMFKNSIFITLPRILVIVLKRFEFNEVVLSYIKINDYFEFPDILDMSKYLSGKNNNNLNNKYVLFGLVLHKGLTYSGHYYTLIKDNNTDYWIKLDDTSTNLVKDNVSKKIFFGVKENNNNSEDSTSSYILFYKKNDWSNCEKFDNYNIKNDNNERNFDKIIINDEKFISDISESASIDDDIESNESFYEDNNLDLFLEKLDELDLNKKGKSDNFNKSKEKKNLNINFLSLSKVGNYNKFIIILLNGPLLKDLLKRLILMLGIII